MKNNFRIISTICIAVFLLVSCSKAKLDNGNADPNAKQHNEDIINTKSESDNSNTDINNALTGMTSFGKNCATQAISICGASIDSSHAHDVVPYIVIAFDGQTVCPNPSRIRGGQVKVELIAGTHWTDAGARLRVTYTNYKIQFPALNNHFLTFNGTKYLTDVNGINWLTIYFGTSTASIRERSYNMTVTFENGQISSWNDARLSTWGMSNQTNLYATVNGDTTIGGKTIDSWGVTRFGTNFTTEMVQPWTSGTVCGWWSPTQGIYTSTTDNFTVTATLGVNSGGTQISSGCAYGFKLNWTIISNNSSGNVILSYF